MPKLSISIPDDVADDLRGLAGGNVSAFVTAAIRHEVDRRRLLFFLDELDRELGPVSDEDVDYFANLLIESAQARPPAPSRRTTKRRAS